MFFCNYFFQKIFPKSIQPLGGYLQKIANTAPTTKIAVGDLQFFFCCKNPPPMALLEMRVALVRISRAQCSLSSWGRRHGQAVPKPVPGHTGPAPGPSYAQPARAALSKPGSGPWGSRIWAWSSPGITQVGPCPCRLLASPAQLTSLIGKKKEHKSNTQSKTSKFYVKNSDQENPKSRMQIHYIIREITGEEERTSQPLCIYNDIHIAIFL